MVNVNLILSLSALAAVNLLIFFLLESKKKYWIPLILWPILLLTFFVYKDISKRNLEKQEQTYYTEMRDKPYGTHQMWQDLEKNKEKHLQTTLILIRLLGLQTILTLIFQIIAYQKLKNPIYWWTRSTFTVLSVLYLMVELAIGVIPRSPLV